MKKNIIVSSKNVSFRVNFTINKKKRKKERKNMTFFFQLLAHLNNMAEQTKGT